MTTDNGNKSAFPLTFDRDTLLDMQQASKKEGIGISLGGLTKREYFAAMAMQGMLAGNINKYPNGYGDRSAGELLISQSIGYANELLKQLSNE